MTSTPLGLTIHTIRESQGVTRLQLAQKAGISFSSVEKIEEGRAKNPSLDTLRAISRALGMKASDLIRLSENVESAA